jgi:hypothetical protein
MRPGDLHRRAPRTVWSREPAHFDHVSMPDQRKGAGRRLPHNARALIVNENILGCGDGFAYLASVGLVGGPIRCHSLRVFLGA